MVFISRLEVAFYVADVIVHHQQPSLAVGSQGFGLGTV